MLPLICIVGRELTLNVRPIFRLDFVEKVPGMAIDLSLRLPKPNEVAADHNGECHSDVKAVTKSHIQSEHSV